ncbi:MBL fold metallo-hydrolase [Bacteroidota bacterium]
MKTIIYLILLIMSSNFLFAQNKFESDKIKTSSGEIEMTFIGRGTLMFSYNDYIIHVDPVGRYADYNQMPNADLILVTHHHGDHLDGSAIGKIKKENTVIICTEICSKELEGIILKNGETKTISDIQIDAVPAYNLVHKRDNGEPFHPKGDGNGYVLTIDNIKIYVAGDTENVPEMKDLKNIDIAFLPMNLPYTMTPEMVANAAEMFNPKILYPYHYGSTDPNKLVELLKDKENIQVRIRQLQ